MGESEIVEHIRQSSRKTQSGLLGRRVDLYIKLPKNLVYTALHLVDGVHQARIDGGEAEGLSTEDKARIKELEKEVRILKMEREILKRAEGFGSGSRKRKHLPLHR